MSKRKACDHIPILDFKPFKWSDSGKLIIPYYSRSLWLIHEMTPDVARKGVGYALAALARSGNVIPFLARNLRDAGLDTRHG